MKSCQTTVKDFQEHADAFSLGMSATLKNYSLQVENDVLGTSHYLTFLNIDSHKHCCMTEIRFEKENVSDHQDSDEDSLATDSDSDLEYSSDEI